MQKVIKKKVKLYNTFEKLKCVRFNELEQWFFESALIWKCCFLTSWLEENFLTFFAVKLTTTSHFNDFMMIIISSFNHVNYDLHHQMLECNLHKKMLKLCYLWETSNRVLIFMTVFRKWLIIMWKLCNYQMSRCNMS